MTLRIATWNVNSLKQRLDHLARWADASQVDVVCLQETKTVDAQFPESAVRAAGFEHIAFTGQKTYNGVAILSRRPLNDVVTDFTVGGEPDPQRRYIRATIDGVTVIGLYVPNGSEVGSEKFAYKLGWLKRLRDDLDATCDPTQPVLVCGDINIAPDDADVWDPFACEGKLLFTAAEKAALQHVLDFGLTDAFRVKNRFSQAFSWWDYRAMGFPRNHGLRIDHIFVTQPLLAQCTQVEIAREVRGWEQPSDHAPVMATFSR